MAEVNAYQVKEVLGMQPTDDGKQMLVGFKTVSDEEVAHALDADSVWKLWIASLTLHR